MDDNLVNLSLQALTYAINTTYQKDYSVIRRNMEQTTVARIFYYMQSVIDSDVQFECLKTFNLDLEYNKDGEHKKRSPRTPGGMRPDLLLHIREHNNGNLLCVEFKMQGANLERCALYDNKPKDWIKLEDLTAQDIYGYKIGVFVMLNHDRPEYTFFKNGEQYYEQDI